MRSHEKDFEEFGGVVREFEWIDLLLCGRQFTWTNKRSNPSFAKLDRFFISSEYDDKFPHTIQKGLASQLSYHSPNFFKYWCIW